MDETKEIFVKVNTNADYEIANGIFNEYKVSCGSKKEQLILNDTWVDLDEDRFEEFRESIYDKIPNCLVVSTINQWYSVSDEEINTVYVKFPNKKYEEEFDDAKIDTYGIEDLKTFLKCLRKIGFELEDDSDTEMSIYKIWGKELDKKGKTSKEDFSLVLNKLKNMTVDNPITDGEITKNTKTICRLCIIAENNDTLEEIKQVLKNSCTELLTSNNYKKNTEFVTKFNYVPNNNMMYVILSDFYDDDYIPFLEVDFDKIAGKFIAVGDSFSLYTTDYVDEEGIAICYFGDELDDRSWDCMQFYEEFTDKAKDNINLNITNVVEFLNFYGFKLTKEEKKYICSFIRQ